MEKIEKMAQFMKGHLCPPFKKERRWGSRAIRILSQPEQRNQCEFSSLLCLAKDVGENGDEKILINNSDHFFAIIKGH